MLKFVCVFFLFSNVFCELLSYLPPANTVQRVPELFVACSDNSSCLPLVCCCCELCLQKDSNTIVIFFKYHPKQFQTLALYQVPASTSPYLSGRVL
jgi:hypothetical protein